MSGDGTAGRFTRVTGSGDFLGIPAEAYDLPHSIDLPVILVVHQVLAAAFAILRKNEYDLAGAKEDPVTMWLRNVIENDLRQSGAVPGFNKRTFEKVTRQQESENYNGTKIRPTPDLVFIPRRGGNADRILSTHFGLYIECKPVGPDHGVTKAYCKNGVERFVTGDYAWAMTVGMMVGYARSGRTIAKYLHPVFALQSQNLAIIAALEQAPGKAAKAGAGHEALHVSEHRRSFPWPHSKGTACPLKLYHSWHACE
jgi:hypothetical protein